MSLSSVLRLRVLRYLVIGLICAVGVAAVGYGLERLRFGATDQDAFARLEQDTRARFAEAASSLSDIATRLAAESEPIAQASSDERAARSLFEATERAIAGETEGAYSVTVFGPAGSRDDAPPPLAWSGRPSDVELIRARLGAGPSLFVVPAAFGLRLVHVEPVIDRSSGRRIGSVAAERRLSARRDASSVGGEEFPWPADPVPVSLRTRYEGAGESRDPYTFLVRSPSGDLLLEARVAPEALRQARGAWRRTVAGAVLAVIGLTVVLLAGPLLDARDRARRRYLWYEAGLAGTVVAAWTLFRAALPPEPGATRWLTPSWLEPVSFFPLFRTAADVLLTGLALVALVVVAFDAVEHRRRTRRGSRRSPESDRSSRLRFLGVQLLAGAAVAGLLAGHQAVLGRLAGLERFDGLDFSVNPWSPSRLAFSAALLFFHAALVWTAVLFLRVATAGWRVPRGAKATSTLVLLWSIPLAVLLAVSLAAGWDVPLGPVLVAFATVMAATHLLRRGAAWYRHTTQAARLIVAFVALVLPGLVAYPALFHYADQAKRHMIEDSFAAQVIGEQGQRARLYRHIRASLEQIDRGVELPGLVAAASVSIAGDARSSSGAFQVWRQTDLARYRIPSAVELYSADGSLVSRWAFSLPEYGTMGQPWWESSCEWDMFEQVSPFGSEERRLAHAARGVCAPPRGRPGAGFERTESDILGAIVVHAMLDYESLPFLTSQNPYFEMLSPAGRPARADERGHDVEFMLYGWGRTTIYASGSMTWPLDEATFARIYSSREPFWTEIASGGRTYAIYILNDRFGIYVLGYPLVTLVGHLVNMAELAAVAGLAYLAILAAAGLFAVVTTRRSGSGRALLREIRASFYRKLFLAFVAVSVVPVITLALVARAYIASRLLADVQSAAVKTTEVAQRLVEDRGTLRQQDDAEQGAVGLGAIEGPRGDDIMVWISQVIDQDVNIYDGARLIATSERDLFDSGFLPTRTPADVYRAIVLSRLPSHIGEERAGDFRYMTASAPVGPGDGEGILTVPLTLRQQEIEEELSDLNRRIVLAAILFILFGAGIGYPIAERIADPVNRLTRATQRIARGELDARIAATSSDELRRLVEAFNSMAAELKRKGEQLQRTHRLEAWAEMARQVAHEIKNPLTPIQLSAEHLRRVHSDRGRPLAPVLDECVDSILTQVRLLRQIASEFSSFASSPTPRPSPTAIGELLQEVTVPYRAGLSGKVDIHVDVAPGLPTLSIDRTLVGRALTNIIDNALHAMPAGGQLSIGAGLEEGHGAPEVRITVTDTGVGMDAEALRRLFEPYFSTKAIGTGLGLTIARRNVEMSGGRIGVDSVKGRGTTVTVHLPVVTAAALEPVNP